MLENNKLRGFHVVAAMTMVMFWSTVFCSNVIAQQGCTEPRATNFNSSASQNDGTCTFPAIGLSPRLKANLPSAVEETSALLNNGSTVWTINDSGNLPVLYLLDTATGQVTKEVTVTNATNDDWEALAEDPTHIYIGDFGNNDGNRTNLRVLVINKADIGPAAQVNVNAVFIRFSYPDQTSWASSNTHNFDCEAFVWWNDTLHLFTKNWGNYQTKHYTLPSSTGFHVATLVGSYNVNCLVTDASIISGPNGKPQLALLGYDRRDLATCLWLFWDMDHMGRPFAMNRWRLSMPNMALMGQIEGLCFKDAKSIFISSEKRSPLAPRLTMVPTLPHAQSTTALGGPQSKSLSNLKLQYSELVNQLNVGFQEAVGAGNLMVQDAAGRQVHSQRITTGTTNMLIDVSQWPSGKYWVQCSGGQKQFQGSFVKP